MLYSHISIDISKYHMVKTNHIKEYPNLNKPPHTLGTFCPWILTPLFFHYILLAGRLHIMNDK